MMKKLSLAGVAVFAASFSAFSSDVFHDYFEDGASRWNLPSGQWKVVDGAGLDGSRALVLEYAKDEIPKWIERNQMVPVEPGEAYRIEAWVNESEFNAKDHPVSISFAVYDAKNRLLKGAGAGSERKGDNIVRKDGFCRVEGTTRPLPMNASKGRFYIWAKEGSHGRVAFDGFRIYPVSVNALESLCCSAYRNEAESGIVGFSAGYAVNELKHDVRRLRAELRYVSLEGERTVSGVLSNGVASVNVPVESFAFGTNKVSMSLKIGGKTLGCLDCEFARVKKLPERRVSFDRYGRTVLDGKPFFPLGMYWNDVNAADLAVYTNSAFNCIMPYKRPDLAKMDMCAAAGVKVIYPICGFYELMAGTNVQKAARYRSNYVDGLVEKFRSHPATLAWYLADELPVTYAKHLEDRRQMCHRLDPDHPTWVCINRPASVRPLLNGYDAVGMDPYPVGSPWGDGSLGLAADWALQAQREMYGYRPMWHIPQAFDWAHYVKKTYAGQDKNWRKPKNMRMPTREEMQSMTWQAIAAGANGIVYYYFEDAYRRGATKEESARRWADVCAVAREVKEREHVLLSEPGPQAEFDSGSVVCRTWSTKEGLICLLACNVTDKAVEAEVRVGDRSVSLSLSPFEVKWTNFPRSRVSNEISGVYPHLTMFNNEGECGTGAVVPWAGDLWAVTYGPHSPVGSSDRLYRIKPDLTRETFPLSVGGTHANRMIHRETNQLLIGPYVIDAKGNVRVVSPERMPGRLTGVARHLTDPANKVYVATMETGLYELDMRTLEVNTLIRENGKNDGMIGAYLKRRAKPWPVGWDAAPVTRVPGYHAKGLVNGFGRVFISNNGEDSAEARRNPFVPSGVLAWWSEPGRDWTAIRRCQFTEVTTRDGIYGNEHPQTNPVWAMGWDAKSVILGVTTNGAEWTYYRLPKASHCYDGAHGWNTEWPRIRDVGFGDGTLLATMHGTFWRFPKEFSPARPDGIRPVSTYLKVIGDFCRWGDRIVFGCDDQTKDEFLGKRGLKKDAPRCERSQSNLWFVKPDGLREFGPPSGEGYVWLDEDVKAGDVSDPYLYAGYETKRFSFTRADGSPVRHELVKEGDWVRVKCLEDAGKATACFRYGPAECKIPALDGNMPYIELKDDNGKVWRFPNVNGDVNVVCREIATERDLLYVGGVWYEVPAENAGGFAALRPIALADEPVKTLYAERGLMYLNGKAMVIDDLWKNGTAPSAYWLWEKSK